MQLRTLNRVYKEALEQEDYGFINEVIGQEFFSLKKVQKAFERLIGTEHKPRRINPNPYDTPTYFLMKPSEQANVELMFMDDVLTGKRVI